MLPRNDRSIDRFVMFARAKLTGPTVQNSKIKNFRSFSLIVIKIFSKITNFQKIQSISDFQKIKNISDHQSAIFVSPLQHTWPQLIALTKKTLII